jgi:hypothetical protein
MTSYLLSRLICCQNAEPRLWANCSKGFKQISSRIFAASDRVTGLPVILRRSFAFQRTEICYFGVMGA